MTNKRWISSLLSILVLLNVVACVPELKEVREESELKKQLPSDFPIYNDNPEPEKGAEEQKAENTAPVFTAETRWQDFFSDPHLKELVDLALKNNQELNIVLQEVQISENEIMARRGEYWPKLGLGGEAGIEKSGEYTHQAATNRTTQYEPGEFVPEPLQNYRLGLQMSWEVDIWRKLRNSAKAALHNYMASVDAKNFLVTQLVAEIANTYYELMALDNLLEIVEKNIEIQTQALELMDLQWQAARTTALAVKRFKAEVLKNRGRLYEIRQAIVQKENELNFLVGRFPQPIVRNSENFIELKPVSIQAGIPSEILKRRPDVRQAENQLAAAKLDVKAARARFYPSLSIEAGAGYESFNSRHLFMSPESTFYNAAAGLTAPLLNRQGIKADYFSANNKQIQAVFNYEKTLLTAYTEVANQMASIENLQKSFELKAEQTKVLEESVEVSSILFKAARADYVEVLMTRRDALEAQMELVELKQKKMSSFVKLYQALGGGWQPPTDDSQGS